MVITIIGILVGLLLPGVQRVRGGESGEVRNPNSLRWRAHYHVEHGSFPPGVQQTSAPRLVGYRSNVVRLPASALEQDSLYRQWDFNVPLNNTVGGTSARTATILLILLCLGPNSNNPVFEQQRLVLRPHELWRKRRQPRLRSDMQRWTVSSRQPVRLRSRRVEPKPVTIEQVSDGLSNTFLFGER